MDDKVVALLVTHQELSDIRQALIRYHSEWQDSLELNLLRSSDTNLCNSQSQALIEIENLQRKCRLVQEHQFDNINATY